MPLLALLPLTIFGLRIVLSSMFSFFSSFLWDHMVVEIFFFFPLPPLPLPLLSHDMIPALLVVPS